MLRRHLLGYVPANIVPAAISFLSVYAFTRLLSPEAYGAYAVTLSLALMCQSVFFYWLQFGVVRFIARAKQDGRSAGFAAAVYQAFAASAVLASVVYGVASLVAEKPASLAHVVWVGLPLSVFRALTALNQSFHRGEMKVARYNVIECGQALLGFLLALLLVNVFDLGALGFLFGLLAAAIVFSLVDLPMVARALMASIDRDQLRALARFGLPLTGLFVVNFLLSTSDRLLIEYFLGSAAVGVYSVSYGIAERALTVVFVGVSLAAFPLAVSALEQRGAAAAREQLYRNGSATLGITIPACAGLVALNPIIVQVIIGEEFRAGAAAVMPGIALSTLLNNLQAHYLSHGFHLSGKPERLIYINGPAALLNVILNVLLLPRLGLIGAVYASLISYSVALVGCVWFGRKVFPFDFPWAPTCKILLATAAMFSGIRFVPLPATRLGLLAGLLLGAALYGLAALSLDIGGLRRLALGKMRGKRAPSDKSGRAV